MAQLIDFDDVARHDIQALMDVFEVSEEDAIKAYLKSKELPYDQDTFEQYLGNDAEDISDSDIPDTIEDAESEEVQGITIKK